jgi:hypothetical protein
VFYPVSAILNCICYLDDMAAAAVFDNLPNQDKLERKFLMKLF